MAYTWQKCLPVFLARVLRNRGYCPQHTPPIPQSGRKKRVACPQNHPIGRHHSHNKVAARWSALPSSGACVVSEPSWRPNQFQLGEEALAGAVGAGAAVFLQVSGGWRARKDPDLWSDSSRPWGPEMAARLPPDRDHVSACVPVLQTSQATTSSSFLSSKGASVCLPAYHPCTRIRVGSTSVKMDAHLGAPFCKMCFPRSLLERKEMSPLVLTNKTERPSPGPAFSLYLDGNIPGIRDSAAPPP